MTEVNPLELKRVLEALLFTASEPLSPKKIIGLLGDAMPVSASTIRDALAELCKAYEDRAVVLVEVAGGFRFQAAQDVAQWVIKAHAEKPPRLSPAFLETLALIAYKQPITRGEIEDVRGVAVNANILRGMMEREWVKVVGHREVPGRPELLATTAQFLNDFGLKRLTDLPPLSEADGPDAAGEQLQLMVDEAETAAQNAEITTPESQAGQPAHERDAVPPDPLNDDPVATEPKIMLDEPEDA